VTGEREKMDNYTYNTGDGAEGKGEREETKNETTKNTKSLLGREGGDGGGRASTYTPS
jgi:hypothetical protein